MTAAPAGLSHRAAARSGEVRLPAGVAVLVAATLQAALPHELRLLPRFVIPAVEVALLVPLVLVNPHRLTRETRWSRIVGLLLAGVLIVVNTVSLGFLLRELVSSSGLGGRALLVAALQVWATNMIAFALVFWELDRGGAVARGPSADAAPGRADFWFPQDDPDTRHLIGDGWIPTFVDYLYLSITNSTAFSPTDTLPLTTRAKALMAVEALAAMVTSLLVVARAVNVLH